MSHIEGEIQSGSLENSELRNISGSKKDEVTGKGGKFRNEQLP